MATELVVRIDPRMNGAVDAVTCQQQSKLETHPTSPQSDQGHRCAAHSRDERPSPWIIARELDAGSVALTTPFFY
jgi:hypothetical protein